MNHNRNYLSARHSDSISMQSDSKPGLKSIEIESNASNIEHINTAKFNNQLQFWLSCLGYAVGYGNIWRFPYMLYNNGGGVFFIPFIICIIIICYPLFYLEVAYGQLFRK
jgi:hypothetical protein